MPEIDFDDVLKNMIGAASASLGNAWEDAKAYAEAEFTKMRDTLAFIQTEVVAGRMTPERAGLHLRMQKNAATAVLLTLEGLGILAVENAINAALDAVKAAVNTALGFPLI